ncbi:MAG TPA: ATP-binding protein [Candidatus Omnitrophota bacterium]|nr:ATP-binding protein [Candidatus Omnitrophota bacterium]HPT07239.1 ATP-binding protein [Candidatus Omnitrophota bacterium]
MIMQGPEFYISKRMGRAIMDYSLLAQGDRIAVALSGGMDSLTLLQVMVHRQSFVPVKYELVAVHIDEGISKRSRVQLKQFCAKLNVPLHIYKSSLASKKVDEEFSWFSGKRRDLLLRQAQRLKCNKVAVGQHKDDVVETILLKMFFAGRISLLPALELASGKPSVIRPMVYVEQKLIQSFLKTAKFPKITTREFPVESAKRAHIAGMIRVIEKSCPEVKTNMFRSLTRVKKDYLL